MFFALTLLIGEKAEPRSPFSSCAYARTREYKLWYRLVVGHTYNVSPVPVTFVNSLFL